MSARVNHVAIASDQYALNGRFYESLFGMKPSAKPRPRVPWWWAMAMSAELHSAPRGRYSGPTISASRWRPDDTIARIAKFDPR